MARKKKKLSEADYMYEYLRATCLYCRGLIRLNRWKHDDFFECLDCGHQYHVTISGDENE